ncbi:phospholipid scramblase 3-like isoform X2 [Rhinatrema bivittatum]|uniref:phospholipid scramblase 3-like isoform X2 n=1 Tax=Rhinatrema bivittatum TaxID=194408 RepID=UPI001128D239|nr:phospholipid scramblase 3-like isoform X2 [Rhinatrema bivittatum]
MSMSGYLIPQPDGHRTQMPGYQPLESSLPADPAFQHQPQECPGPDPQNVVPYMPEILGIPLGLEYLTQINQILLRQKFYSPQNINHYEIQNNMGQRIYSAKEQKEFCGNLYHVKIMDNSEREVIQLLEIYKCFTSQREVEIQSPPGRIIGYITYAWQAFVTSLSVLDASKEPVLMVVGPGFQTNLFGDVNFEVKTKDKSQTVGKITKDSEVFLVQMPWDLDVQIKVILMGASLFLDHLVDMRRRQVLVEVSP